MVKNRGTFVMRSIEDMFSKRLSSLYTEKEARELARICLQEVLSCSFSQLLMQSPLSLSDEQKSRIDNLLSRLTVGEPWQYVLGKADFCGLQFAVSPSVLIPRPETAELVEWIASDCVGKKVSVLDVGTGSGCIAVTLAHLLPLARVSAVDVSDEALVMAERNAADNKCVVSFSVFDVLKDCLPIDAVFDVIVSNPPYVCNSERSDMHINVLGFEPSLALFVPDEDPLLFYRSIAHLALLHLADGGRVFFEINERFGCQVQNLLLNLGFCEVLVRKDLEGKDRMVAARFNA